MESLGLVIFGSLAASVTLGGLAGLVPARAPVAVGIGSLPGVVAAAWWTKGAVTLIMQGIAAPGASVGNYLQVGVCWAAAAVVGSLAVVLTVRLVLWACRSMVRAFMRPSTRERPDAAPVGPWRPPQAVPDGC